jgi:hypothetical protein
VVQTVQVGQKVSVWERTDIVPIHASLLNNFDTIVFDAINCDACPKKTDIISLMIKVKGIN